MTTTEMVPKLVLVCDMQKKFTDSIYRFEEVENTICHLSGVCRLLSFSAVVTTQNASKLGDTVLSITQCLPPGTPIDDKSRFSMLIPKVSDRIHELKPKEIVLVGIETHICVSQTALDLVGKGYFVTVLADGVSASSIEEHDLALLRLRQAGVRVVSFESWLFETIKTASHEKFREVSAIVKARRMEREKHIKASL